MNFYSRLFIFAILSSGHIIPVNVISLFFQIFNIESVENKHYFLAFNFIVRTLIWHLIVITTYFENVRKFRKILCIHVCVLQKFTRPYS